MDEIPDLIKLAILLLVITVAAFFIYVRRIKNKENQTSKPTATVRDIPAIVDTLAKHAMDGSWVMFVVPQTETSDSNDVTIQFSVENGEVCFDWLLDNGLGEAHRGKFEDLARRRGWPVSEMKTAGFHYLRIQGMTPLQIADVGKDVLSTLYQVGATEQIEIEDDAPNWRVGA